MEEVDAVAGSHRRSTHGPIGDTDSRSDVLPVCSDVAYLRWVIPGERQ